MERKATHLSNSWEEQDIANEWQLPQEGQDGWEKVAGPQGQLVLSHMAHVDAPKEIEESKGLDGHTNEGPAAEHKDDAGEEADSPTDLLLARKEVERLLWADEQRDPTKEEHIAEGEESGVKEEQDADAEEEGAEGHEAHAELLLVREPHDGW